MNAREKLCLGLISLGKPYTAYMGLNYAFENGLGLILTPEYLKNLAADGYLLRDPATGSSAITMRGKIRCKRHRLGSPRR